ncbi:MAG: DotD/TraH family lipoprotein [Alphaproteobacteria bacterium]|nr:DotD/TraH family lipoprotein [Alphaproteobacteria bacterium]
MMIALKNSQKALLLAIGMALVGCSSMQLDPVATEPDLVSMRLAQAAEKAAKALDTISGIEQEREPQLPAPQDYSSAPPALTQLITVRWSGPIEQMVDTLATRAGMRYQAVGGRPNVPLLINLDVYQKPLIEVLHDLGLQAGRRADISVNSSNNTIEIRYAPVDRT